MNSGWTGGIYGVGRRMPIKVTRALVTGALDGSLKNAQFRTDPYFGFAVPTSVPGIETSILNPDQTWADKKAFDETARKLVGMFQKNFTKFEQTRRRRSARRGAGSAASPRNRSGATKLKGRPGPPFLFPAAAAVGRRDDCSGIPR